MSINPVVINLIIWVPFVLVIVPAIIKWCIRGYKEGLMQALLSLSATIIAGILSIFFANLLATIFAPVVKGWIGSVDAKGVVALIIGDGLRAELSLVLYSVIISFLPNLLKWVYKKYLSHIKEKSDKRVMKFAGLGVSLVDCVVFALLFTIPIYGSLAIYSPAIKNIIGGNNFIVETVLKEEQKANALDTIDVINTHPLVAVASTNVSKYLYGNLSKNSAGKEHTTIEDNVNAISDVLAVVQKAAENPAKITEEDITKIIDIICNNPGMVTFFRASGGQEIIDDLKQSLDNSDMSKDSKNQISTIIKEIEENLNSANDIQENNN